MEDSGIRSLPVEIQAVQTAPSGNPPLADNPQNPPHEPSGKNKAIVLEAFDTLSNQRDYAKAETFWSPACIQHSAHIEPGREGPFKLIQSLPEALRYEHGVIMAEGEFVMINGRFSGNGSAAALIAVDTVRMENGVLKEHWGVLEDEATATTSASSLPMFGESLPNSQGSPG